MYGSIFRMRPRRGREKDIVALMEEWDRQRRPKARGARAGYLFRPNDRTNELIGVAVFDDRATYEANAADPEQHQWYTRLREMLEADPAWEDGEYLAG